MMTLADCRKRFPTGLPYEGFPATKKQIGLVIQLGVVGFSLNQRRFDIKSWRGTINLGLISVCLVLGSSTALRSFRG